MTVRYKIRVRRGQKRFFGFFGWMSTKKNSVEELTKEINRLKEFEVAFQNLTQENNLLKEKNNQLTEALELFIETCDKSKIKNRDKDTGKFLPYSTLKRETQNEYDDPVKEKEPGIEEDRKTKRLKRKAEELEPKKREKRNKFAKEHTTKLGDRLWILMHREPVDYEAIEEMIQTGLRDGTTKFLNHSKFTSIAKRGPTYKTTPLDEAIYEHHARLLRIFDDNGVLESMHTSYYSTPDHQTEIEYLEYLDFLATLEKAKDKRLKERERSFKRKEELILYKEKTEEERKRMEVRKDFIGSYTIVCVCDQVFQVDEIVAHKEACEKFLKVKNRIGMSFYALHAFVFHFLRIRHQFFFG